MVYYWAISKSRMYLGNGKVMRVLRHSESASHWSTCGCCCALTCSNPLQLDSGVAESSCHLQPHQQASCSPIRHKSMLWSHASTLRTVLHLQTTMLQCPLKPPPSPHVHCLSSATCAGPAHHYSSSNNNMLAAAHCCHPLTAAAATSSSSSSSSSSAGPCPPHPQQQQAVQLCPHSPQTPLLLARWPPSCRSSWFLLPLPSPLGSW